MNSRWWTRFVLSFVLCATMLGADCEVGRRVVDESGGESTLTPCESSPCSLPIAKFDMPSFTDPAQCNVARACNEVPSESVTSASVLNDSTWRLSSDVPVDMTLSGLEVSGGSIFLSGPVTLRLGTSSLRNVVIVLSAPEGSAGPRLIVEDSTLGGVTIRSSPVGTVELIRSFGKALNFEATSISAHSSSLDGVRFSSADLELVDLALETAELSFDEGYLASILANNVRTVNCGNLATALTSIGGDASEIGPCQELLLLSSSMVDGQLDGPVHMENSRIASVFFGRRLPTNVDGWAGGIERARFCEYTGAIRLSSSLKVSCSSCEGVSAVSACFMDGQPLLLGNACEALRGELTHCADPQPEPVSRR